jgi:hypothetical protein
VMDITAQTLNSHFQDYVLCQPSTSHTSFKHKILHAYHYLLKSSATAPEY